MASTLPQVSWIHGPFIHCEHPAAAPQSAENLVQTVLEALTSNPAVWANTLFIINYDENGGNFDHVTPPTPPGGYGGRVPRREHDPADTGASRSQTRVPRAVHLFVAVHPWRLGQRPSFDHTSTLRLHGDALQCSRTEPLGLAPQRDR